MFAARLADSTIGTCTEHQQPITVGGMVIGQSGNVYVNGLNAARLGDPVVSLCGHYGFITTASSKVYINGIPAARFGDSFEGAYSGTIIGGSTNVFIS